MRSRSGWNLFIALALVALSAGCVERKLTITSDPPGALVYLNGEEVGRTPVTTDFTWYGQYDVALRRQGYETRKAESWVLAPWWQLPPIDFAAELLPLRLTDRKQLHYDLQPAGDETLNPEALVERGQKLRERLEE